MTATSTASQSRDKLHLQLARLFRNKIATGEWPVGQSIPTVEELEALHGVSRTTVRMAVHALVDEGLLETRKRVALSYIAEHGVLVNPLIAEGYPSIGCAPCTVRPALGADPRSGRWQGTAKTECGLHAS